MNLIAMAGAALLAANASAETAATSWYFDADQPGRIAKAFRSEGGDWQVVADDTAPSKPNVLAQLAKNEGSAFNLTLIEGTSYQDLRLSVWLKPIAGSEDQGGGLVWRAQDARNYYVARWNPLEDNFRVYKVVAGRRTQLASAEIRPRPGAWYMLEIEMVGSHIACSFAGKQYLEATDATFPRGGQIGLWTKSDAQTHFDNLEVEPAGAGERPR